MQKVFRLFISSTFDDFRLERAVLQKFIFPEIRRYLNERGINFLPIDLRWGVPFEAQEDQKTMQICLNEVNRSATELHPDLLVMVGDRYGWIPLPEKIEKEEFEEIEKYIGNMELLHKWYRLDKNALPASYILQPVYEVIPNKEFDERINTWWDESAKLTEDIQEAVKKANIPQEKKEKYFLSATHQEFEFYKKLSNQKGIDYKNHIIGYIREIKEDRYTFEELKKAKYKEELKDKSKENYDKLKNEIKSIPTTKIHTIKDSEIFVKDKENIKIKLSEEDIEKLDSVEELPKYLKEFYEYTINSIKEKVEEELKHISQTPINFQEQYKNEILKDSLIDDKLIGREEDIKKIKDLLKENKRVIISSPSGIGKSALIAKIIDDFQKENKNFIYRFCGVGDIKSVESLLKDILLNEFEDKLDEEFKELLTKKEEILNQDKETKKIKREKIKSKFLELTQNTLIILDALDQLEEKDDELDWLPENFLISVLNDENYEEDSYYYKALSQIPDIKEYRLTPLKNKEDIKKLILQNLKKENRTLQENQIEYILSKKDSKNPLYLKIANEEIKTWRSYDELTDNLKEETTSKRYLSNTQKEIIKEYIKNLYTIKRNNKLLVERIFGYIVASQNHLDEELLIEVLSNDEEVLKSVENKFHKNISHRLPDAVWARVRGDIISFLKEDTNNNIQFFHREFKDAAKSFYSEEVGDRLLRILEKLENNRKLLITYIYTIELMEANDCNIDYTYIFKFLKVLELNNRKLLTDFFKIYREIITDMIKESNYFNKKGIIKSISKIINEFYFTNRLEYFYWFNLFKLSEILYVFNMNLEPRIISSEFLKELRIQKKFGIDNNEHQNAVYLNFATYFIENKDFEKAEQILNKLDKMVNPNDSNYLHLLFNKSIIFIEQNKFSEALELLINLKEILQNKATDLILLRIYIQVLLELAKVYDEMNEDEKAYNIFKELEDFFKRKKYYYEKVFFDDYIKFLNSYGLFLYYAPSNIRDEKKGEELLLSAKRITYNEYKKNKNIENIAYLYAMSLQNLGIFYKWTGIKDINIIHQLWNEALLITKKFKGNKWKNMLNELENNLSLLKKDTLNFGNLNFDSLEKDVMDFLLSLAPDEVKIKALKQRLENLPIFTKIDEDRFLIENIQIIFKDESVEVVGIYPKEIAEMVDGFAVIDNVAVWGVNIEEFTMEELMEKIGFLMEFNKLLGGEN